MQTFAAEVWTPGLESNTTSSLSRRQAHPSQRSQKGGNSPKTDKKPFSIAEGRQSFSAASTTSSNGPNATGNGQQAHRKPSSASTMNNGSSSSGGYSSGDNANQAKKHGILYRIFHPDHDGSHILGRSRRSYNSGSESEMESEDEYASDTAGSDMEAHGGQMYAGGAAAAPNGNHHGMIMNFNALARKTSAQDVNPAPAPEKSSAPRLMSMSVSRKPKPKTTDADSASESESEAYGSGLFRRDTRSKASGGIFNKVLNTRARKTSSASTPSSPTASEGNLSNASGDSGSDSDADHHHGTGNKLFKNIMTSRRDTPSSSHGGWGFKSSQAAARPPTAPASAAPSRKTSVSSTASAAPVPAAAAAARPPPASVAKAAEPTIVVTAAAAAQQPAKPKPVDQPPSPALTTVMPVGLSAAPIQPATGTLPRNASETSLAEKYGRKEEVLGKGANAVVRLCCPMNSNKKYAIKEFRKRRKEETQKEYVKKLVAEFCISSTLDHPNVVKTVDLIQDEKKKWCVVMEYCAGGDLFSRISSGTLTDPEEMSCYFKQLASGVKYLHSMGVAHRDLKPENLLLDATGQCLKITDFGVSEVFRTPFGKNCTKAHGVCGSGPYIAPEEFVKKEYDSEQVDVWAIGIIYYVMLYNSIPWKSAQVTDARFKHYVDHLNNFWPLDRLPPGPRAAMYKILEPNPEKRMTLDQLFENEWFKSIHVCLGHKPEEVGHKHIRTPVEK
ncbi:serine/threonine-protein kinase HAL4/sat4 [Phlyctochytrium bullatum]|nr:serine/threonine-protein kinase HAL4/sat4 [Phlyctochytrium bullatum]